jgi:hypothetical protein
MALDKSRIAWTDCRGRNGGDSPLELPDSQVVEAMDIDFDQGALGSKRSGTSDPAFSSQWAGEPYHVLRHVPGNDEGAAELWAFYGAFPFTVGRLTAGTTWSTVSTVDSTFGALPVSGASLNGKLFLCGDSSVNRLHCWDGTNFRRVGLALPAAATVANTGAGAYAATLRYYKVAWAEISGTDHIRRSELGPSVSFTPSGGGTHARVTRPTAAGEGETHWLVYASADDVYSNYHHIATVAIATTTYDDNATPSAYTGDAPQIAGINTLPPSAKFIVSDGNRLLMTGAWETSAGTGGTTPKNNRVWFTRVLGSSDIGDDESIPNTSAVGTIPAQKNWIDVGENTSGPNTGLGILNGVVYVFKQREVWRLIPTGDDLVPYQARNVSMRVGTPLQHTIVQGEDESGAPALYFYSHRGPYRITVEGELQYCGRDVEDLTRAVSPSLHGSVWSLYYPDKRQVWFYLTGVTVPFIVFNVLLGQRGPNGIQGGWARYTKASNISKWTHGAMFSNTPGASMSTDLKPYLVGISSGGLGLIYKADTGTADAGTAFQSYLTSKPYFPAGAGVRVTTNDAVAIAEAAANTTLQLAMVRDFSLETKTGTVSLAAEASETHIIRRVEGTAFGAMASLQMTIGDASAVAAAWTIDAVVVPVGAQESLS